MSSVMSVCDTPSAICWLGMSETSATAGIVSPMRGDGRAANTVSRATRSLPSAPESMIDTMSPTSITVTATASKIEPSGSPSFNARTSA